EQTCPFNPEEEEFGALQPAHVADRAEHQQEGADRAYDRPWARIDNMVVVVFPVCTRHVYSPALDPDPAGLRPVVNYSFSHSFAASPSALLTATGFGSSSA